MAFDLDSLPQDSFLAADAAYRSAMNDVIAMPEWHLLNRSTYHHSDIECHINTDEPFEHKVVHYLAHKAMLLVTNRRVADLSDGQISFLQRLFQIDDLADINHENLQRVQRKRRHYFAVLGHAAQRAISVRQAREEVEAMQNHSVPIGIPDMSTLWELRRRFQGVGDQAEV